MLMAVDPHKNYSTFKEVAEEATSRKWDCPSYKEFNENVLESYK